VAGDSVLIADYKSDRMVPQTVADVPEAYIRQLALYRAVLTRIYPEKTIRAALLFTAGLRIIEIPSAAMDAKLAESPREVTLQ
jgi:ATP-dependent helicase/nuclease subunit A